MRGYIASPQDKALAQLQAGFDSNKERISQKASKYDSLPSYQTPINEFIGLNENYPANYDAIAELLNSQGERAYESTNNPSIDPFLQFIGGNYEPEIDRNTSFIGRMGEKFLRDASDVASLFTGATADYASNVNANTENDALSTIGAALEVMPGAGLIPGVGGVIKAIKSKAGGMKSPMSNQIGAVGDINNYTYGELSAVPDVPQFSLERKIPVKGMPKGLEEILTPETAERMKGYAIKGEQEGGRAWYNLDPLRKAYVDQLGDVNGTQDFNRFVDILAATSPRTKVDMNIRRASYLRNQEKAGNPLDTHANFDAETGIPKKGRPNGLPPGYGHLAHETQQGLLSDLSGGQHFQSLTRPKTASFAENLKGNQEPMTIDTHNMAALIGDFSIKKSPTAAQYKYVEDFQAGLAKELDMTPAQWQASVWMGAGTGVADARPFMDVFRTVIARTAEKANISKSEALKKFINGELNLWQFVAPVTAAGIGFEAMGDRSADL